MDAKTLKTIFEIGETIAVEFKRCGNGIENDVYETVCSFLNRFGGDLFMGVLMTAQSWESRKERHLIW